MNGFDQLAAFIVGLQSDDIAPPAMDKLRLHVVDTIGAWIAATRTAEGRALIAFGSELHSAGEGSTKRNLFDNLLINCALARLSEVDDIHLASMTTPGSIVIPAAMKIAATLPKPDVGEVAAAVIGGYEAMIRLASAIKGPDILYRGIWPTYFTASLGSAAVAARLMRLDERQAAHALALALTMAAPTVGQHHAVTTSRWLSVGNAARNGLMAARASRAGFTSDVGVLQSRLLADVYGINLDIEKITAGYDNAFSLDQVSFKPWCAARQTMAATQGLRELIDGGVAVADIGEIAVSVLPPHLKMIDHGIKPGDRASHLTSLPYQMAVAALQPEKALDVDQSPAKISPALQSFMALIKMTADDGLLAEYPESWPARIVVTTSSGKHERLVRHVPGDPARPFAKIDVSQKFHRLVASVLGESGARTMFEAGLAALQSADSLLSVMRELDGATTPD